MKLFANILLIMSMMLLLVSSVSALTANSYYYSGDGSTSVNSIISKVDINNSNLLYTGMADHDIEYPTVCDAIGDGYDQYFSYENHVITAHAIVDGQLQEIAYLELADPS